LPTTSTRGRPRGNPKAARFVEAGKTIMTV
jgi:hypothetical protein